MTEKKGEVQSGISHRWPEKGKGKRERRKGKAGEVQIVDVETVKIGDASFKFDSRHVWAGV